MIANFTRLKSVTMGRKVVAVGLTIIMVSVLITLLKIYAPTDQQDTSTLRLPTPSPTWLFSALSPDPTSDLKQGISVSRKATSQPTPTPHPEMLKRGQYLFYAVGCFYCHGIKAEGDIGPKIAHTDLPLELVIQQVYQPDDEMPVFPPSVVSESELAAIYAYLQSLNPTGPRPRITTDHPNAATGKALYHFFGCFGCHGYNGEGGFGLQLAGTMLSLEEVRDQIRNPRERMPAFGPEWISNEELAHIYFFLQSLAADDTTN